MSATPATDRLRAWIEERSRGDALDAYRGHDWMQLTEAEEEVFGLALADMAAVSTVFHEWEALIGRVDGELWPEMPSAAAAIRAEHPFIAAIRGKHAADALSPGEFVEGFQQFAALFGISSRTAHAFHYKRLFWDIRRRLVTFRDEG